MKHNINRYNDRYVVLCSRLVEIFGKKSLLLLNDVQNTPTIIAIELPPKTRYDFFRYCAKHKVQTTWYYYPLSLLPQFNTYESESIPSSHLIAQSIVILPFQWTHSEAQFTKFLKQLNSYKVGREV